MVRAACALCTFGIRIELFTICPLFVVIKVRIAPHALTREEGVR
jgi:hypothetical protein